MGGSGRFNQAVLRATGSPPGRGFAAAIEAARQYLLDCQTPEGYWQGVLENDTSSTGQYIILMHYLGRVDQKRQAKAVRYLLRCRNREGGWVQYPGGGSHLDTTAINYVALALAGIPESDPEMEKSRQLVMGLGGLGQSNFFTRIILGFLGLYAYHSLPWMTSRLIDNPHFIYRQGFPRTIVIPYLVLYEKRAILDVSPRMPLAAALWDKPQMGPEDALLQKIFGLFASFNERTASEPHQKKCLAWIIERQERDGTVAGVFQVTLFSLMALHADRDPRWEPAIRKGLQGVVSYQKETRGEIMQQFSISPVMDTAYAIRGLIQAGEPSGSEAVRAATRWLLTRQADREGDWKRNNPRGRPGGWGFEFHNTWYPDLDCTNLVLNAFSYLSSEDREPLWASIDRGLDWILSMQSWDGGFAVWDKNNWLPFRVLTSVLDAGDWSHADITARVLICLKRLQRLPRYRNRADLKRALSRGVWFLFLHQKGFQRWYGRWAANYTYGTGQVLESLGTQGFGASHPMIRRAIQWLAGVQNADGGWGESLASYEEKCFVPGPSTATQTSIVLQGLLRVRAPAADANHRGAAHLLATQRTDGSWEDLDFFAVNIPKVWYGRYELIPTLSALVALCDYRDRRLLRMESM